MLTASCLQCGSDKRQAKWGKNRCGSQRYRCQDCHKVYTPEPMVHGYPLSVRQQAVALHVEGLSLRRIARLLSVNAQSVANWLAAHQNALERTAQATLPTDDPGLGACQTVELDELHVFVGARKGEKKRWVYIATAVDRLTRCIVGWAVVEERTFDTLQPVVDQVPRTCQQFYSDGLNTYPTLLYYNGKHEAHEDKRQTYSVEAVNADIRHYLARLARRSRCFCRKVESLRQAFWLFVYCYNRRRLRL